MNKKVRTARLSIFSNTFLIVIKVYTGILTGSVSILSEAIHSGIDLIASAIAFFAVKISSKAPDDRHPYGHGKFENISGVVEGLLIFVAAFWIIYEAIHKFLHPGEMKYFHLAAAIMFLSAIINFFISRKLYQVAKEFDSIALEADALHLKTDVYSSLGVGIGMVLIWITGWHVLDPIFAIIVALFIMKESFELVKNAFSPLLDAQISKSEYDKLHSEISKFTKEKDVVFNHLRSRRSGPIRIIDFSLLVDPNMTVISSHNICDDIEQNLKNIYNDSDITIHVEPKQNA